MIECFLCQKDIKEIDFKNTEFLKRFISGLGKIRSRKKTGLCAKHQREISRAIKKARHFGLLSATEK